MLQINLLDWRAERRERRKRQFLLALGCGVVAGAVVVGISNHFVNAAIRHQDARNHYLHQQIAIADTQLRQIKQLEKVRSRLLARIDVIQNLQKSRSRIVHFFDSVVDTLPHGVYLTALKQKGGSTVLDGKAQSNGAVSNYLRNLDHSPWFSNPNLVVITTKDKNNKETSQRLSEFTIQVKNSAPSDGSKPAKQAKAGAHHKGANS